MTSTLVPPSPPFVCSARRWCTPKRCCSSMTAKARSRNTHVGLEQRVRADEDVDLAGREARRADLARGLPFSRPVSRRDAQAGLLRERRDRLQMLARQHFGRRHQRRLRAGLDRDRHGHQRDDRLARADVALQQPQHAPRRRHVRLRSRASPSRCERVSAKGSASAMRWRGCAPSPRHAAPALRLEALRARGRARAGRRAARRRRAAATARRRGDTSPASVGRCSRCSASSKRRPAARLEPGRRPATRARCGSRSSACRVALMQRPCPTAPRSADRPAPAAAARRAARAPRCSRDASSAASSP